MSHYMTLEVWREAFELATATHRLTRNFPAEEKYILSAQIRRAAISIPSNIAEGRGRQSDQELKHFCRIAFGSAMELETQLLLAKELELANAEHIETVRKKLDSVLRLLNRFIKCLE
jgi:four helix bundle protein